MNRTNLATEKNTFIYKHFTEMFRCCALLARNNIKSIARYYLRLPSGKAIRKKTSDIHVALKAIACEERDGGGGQINEMRPEKEEQKEEKGK